jgi:hypothetical protein
MLVEGVHRLLLSDTRSIRREHLYDLNCLRIRTGYQGVPLPSWYAGLTRIN